MSVGEAKGMRKVEREREKRGGYRRIRTMRVREAKERKKMNRMER